MLTFAPYDAAAILEARTPPDPAPMVTRSYSKESFPFSTSIAMLLLLQRFAGRKTAWMGI